MSNPREGFLMIACSPLLSCWEKQNILLRREFINVQNKSPAPGTFTLSHAIISFSLISPWKEEGIRHLCAFLEKQLPMSPISGIRGKEARGGRDTGMRIVRGLWDVAHGGSALASREQGSPICYQGFESRNPLTRSNRSTCYWLKIRY